MRLLYLIEEDYTVGTATDCFGELTAEKWIRLSGEKKLCLDCYSEFERFNV